MLERNTINELFGITESYEMPDRVMEILMNEKARMRCFNEITKISPDMKEDFFLDYYQEEHGDRKELKQDYTPDCVATLASEMAGTAKTVADICAGTGSLTIKMWLENPDAFFHCEEFSSRAIPILLLNLMIRNMSAEVVRCDCLSGSIFEIYNLEPGPKFSTISKAESPRNTYYDVVVTNPPYSLRWGEVDDFQNDKRFRFGITPKQYSDYAFVMHGLSRLKTGGILVAIVPHGVLFRGGKEQTIRRGIIEAGYMNTIVGLPNNLFMNTGIPVCIMALKEDSSDLLFVDASKYFDKHGKQNVMNEEHIKKVLDVYLKRRYVQRYSAVATMQEVEENDYNLNIPRYVDTFIPEAAPDIVEVLESLRRIDKEIHDSEKKLLDMLLEMTGTTQESDRELKNAIEEYKNWMDDKYKKEVDDSC